MAGIAKNVIFSLSGPTSRNAGVLENSSHFSAATMISTGIRSMSRSARERRLQNGQITAGYIASTHMATPMPPPMQSVARPFLAPRRFIS